MFTKFTVQRSIILHISHIVFFDNIESVTFNFNNYKVEIHTNKVNTWGEFLNFVVQFTSLDEYISFSNIGKVIKVDHWLSNILIMSLARGN